MTPDEVMTATAAGGRGLAMELVATSDLREGEIIYVDPGSDWYDERDIHASHHLNWGDFLWLKSESRNVFNDDDYYDEGGGASSRELCILPTEEERQRG